MVYQVGASPFGEIHEIEFPSPRCRLGSRVRDHVDDLTESIGRARKVERHGAVHNQEREGMPANVLEQEKSFGILQPWVVRRRGVSGDRAVELRSQGRVDLRLPGEQSLSKRALAIPGEHAVRAL